MSLKSGDRILSAAPVRQWGSESQLRDSFPSVDFGDRLELELYPLAEHTYPLVRGRARVIARVVDWMNREFGR